MVKMKIKCEILNNNRNIMKNEEENSKWYEW